jgi:hypothetical protein
LAAGQESEVPELGVWKWEVLGQREREERVWLTKAREWWSAGTGSGEQDWVAWEFAGIVE